MIRYLTPGFSISCDCIRCESGSTWRQEFRVKEDIIIVRLCNNHHYILRTKINSNIDLDEDVLAWLLVQPSEIHRVTRYCMYRHIDRKIMKNIWKILK